MVQDNQCDLMQKSMSIPHCGLTCVNTQFASLSSLQGHNYGQSSGLSRQLHDRLVELQRIGQQMDSLWRMQSLRESNSKRDIWKHKVEQVLEECDALGAALDKHTHKERRYCFWTPQTTNHVASIGDVIYASAQRRTGFPSHGQGRPGRCMHAALRGQHMTDVLLR